MWLSIGFVIGCVTTVFYYQTLVFTLFTLSLVIGSVYFKPFLSVLLGFICGILCVWVHFLCFYTISYPDTDENQSKLVTFDVVEIISKRDNYYLKAKLHNPQSILSFKAPHALVSLKADTNISIGDRVTTRLKLTKFRSQKNFNGFDRERYAFSQRLFFKAKQTSASLQIIKSYKLSSITAYRDFINSTYQNTQMNWLYYALLTGDRGLMSYDQKQTLQQFGLSHLLAISGLHISLMFGIGYFITKHIVRLFIRVINQTVNLSLIYSVGGFSLAFCYVYLSDFLVSATRALIMLGCYLLVYFYSKQALKWQSLLYALVLTLAIDPFSLLNPGLYFSFCAVAIIFLILNRLSSFRGGFIALLKNLTVIQCALFIGLLPLSLYFFNGVSLIGLVVNLIAIPLLSFVIMPSLVMLSSLSIFISIEPVIQTLDPLLTLCFNALLYIPSDYRWLGSHSLSLVLVQALYLTGIMFYMLPTKRLLALIPVCIALVDTLLQTKPDWQLNVFDVGHGTMVLISKNNKGFVYDLGPIYFNQYTRVNSTLLPHIQNNAITVEHSVVSHMDKDHAGGLRPWLAQGYLATFNLLQPNGPEQVCLAKQFMFQGLVFTVSKNLGSFTSNNDNSCVIHISDGAFSVLLPGDITMQREHELIKQNEQLKSTILLSPHHGSKTSSSDEFIAAVSPDVVLHSTSYKGQWGLPHEEVVKRYLKKHVQQYSTAEHGQISIKFYQNEYKIEYARAQSYWFLKD
ncbi:DNA internalization-related competence protein ComEC/Rec2 [Pseudoalteromonas sp. ZZD1]|uniref:DNA internalization-related competence protein ComEC/Rec2 n=1 Tax=Pseudoalteromonas sp. ZZD1 TaxID=3139395 RepID=UPI003BAADAEA